MNALLAVGLLLTTATQFRLSGIPLGPGDLCLAAWIMLAAGRALVWTAPAGGPALSRLLLFWALFGVAQSLGTFTGFAIDDVHDPNLFLHDVVAYTLMAAFSCLGVFGAGAGERLHRVAHLLVAFGGAALLIQLLAAWGVLDIPLVDPWFGDRYRGWSNNPNQLALFCFILLFLSLHLAETATRPGTRLLAVACAVPAVIIGRLTKTDTFTFAVIAATPLFLGLTLRNWIAASPRTLTLRSAFAGIVAIGTPLVLAASVPLALYTFAGPQSVAMDLTKNGGKEAAQETALRMELWQEAISRGLEAKMLGLGPGPHLPIPPSIIAARQTEPNLDTGDHPKVNNTPDFEAHNTVLDLFAQGGAIAVLSLIWLVASAFRTTWTARGAGLASLLCGIGVFAMTNLIVRQPIVWFSLMLCLVSPQVVGAAFRSAGRDLLSLRNADSASASRCDAVRRAGDDMDQRRRTGAAGTVGGQDNRVT